ncbi:ubiquitin-conjugating enzyme E2 R2-like [Tubulanus polymorphus]|uniref:ubiquitin-conjugating enzyme E2 R2-like n=1 Tax=Tubulanus polymorphus TaxID=672921 RepID=UPI003DA3A2DF
MAHNPSSAVRALQLEYKKIRDEPVEGFRVEANDENLFEWDVAIFGPPRTLYEGGYFKAKMTFPPDYPYSPPSIKFTSEILHPNVYKSGDVCISILHPPVDDPQSGELPSERWNPTQTVRTILLSVISLLNEPNIFSPADVDASVMYRKWRDSKDSKCKDKDTEYENIIKQQVAASRLQAEEDNVKVPTTVSEYCITAKPKHSESTHDQASDFLVDDFADCDYDDMDDDDDDEDDDNNYYDDEDDSGNGES